MDTFDKLVTFPEARQLGLQHSNYLSLFVTDLLSSILVKFGVLLVASIRLSWLVSLSRTDLFQCILSPVN